MGGSPVGFGGPAETHFDHGIVTRESNESEPRLPADLKLKTFSL
jgi:hypothetical protein